MTTRKKDASEILRQPDTKRFYLLAIGATLLVLLIGTLFTIYAAKTEAAHMRESLLTETRLAKIAINWRRIQRLTGTTDDLVSPDYLRLKEQLKTMRTARTNCRFTYLMGFKPNGTVFFYLDSEMPGSRDYSPPGQIYPEVSEALKQVFLSGHEITEGPINDRWGRWISGLVPITDPQTNKCIAVFGMDVDARNWNRQIAEHCIMPILTTLFFTVLQIAFINYMMYIRTRREKQLIETSEAALRESEEKFRALTEETNDIIYSIDVNGIIEYIGPQVSRYGLSEKMVGRNFIEFVHPEDQEQIIKDFTKMLETGKEFISEFRIPDENGNSHWIEELGRIRRDNTGAIIGSRGVLRDISDRKHAEAALFESAALLRKAQQIAHIGSWELNETTHELRWSDETFRIFGYVPEAITPTLHLFFRSVHPEDMSSLKEAIRISWKTRIPLSEDHRIILPDGEVRIVHELAEMIYNDSGQPEKWMGTVQDITERKKSEAANEKLENQLIQAQKMESVGRLAGGVAHDFNNLLTVIMANTEMALMSIDSGRAVNDEINEIRKASERAADLTRQLLAFARKQTIAPKALNLNITIEGMLKMLRRLIGENITLDWKPGSDLWPVKIDPSQVDQILANLSVNSRDSINGIGALSIETNNVVVDEISCVNSPGLIPGEYVMLSVSDTGAGMDSNTLAQLFEPFFTTKEVGRGTGLGLSTVYGIVKQNNGYINVYSELGYGATISIYLPRIQTEVTVSVENSTLLPSHGTETILMAEDEPTILDLGKAILEGYGYNVITANTPGEAIALSEAHKGPIHLLVTDVVMPEMNGKELRDILSLKWPEMKALFMSGYTANVIAHHGVIDEGIQFLQKPFSVKSLAAKVREVLDL